MRFENLLFVSVDFAEELGKGLSKDFARLASLVDFRIRVLYFLEMKFGFYLWRGRVGLWREIPLLKCRIVWRGLSHSIVRY